MPLKSFKLLAKVRQEKNTLPGSIDYIVWSFNIFLKVLEKIREKYNIEKLKKLDKRNKNPPLSQKSLSYPRTYIDYTHILFSKYYILMDKTKAYIVAMVLDLRQKYRYFKEHWNTEYLLSIYKKTETMYKEFHINNDMAALLSTLGSQESYKKSHKRKAGDNDFDILGY